MANPTGVYVLPEGAFTHQTVLSILFGSGVLITASGAVAPDTSHRYLVTKAGVAALTLAAPVRDNIRLEIRSTTAFAHTLTATGLLQSGAAGTDLATFAAFGGAGLVLASYNGKWVVMNSVGITFS
jgi:hypothetical protein